MSYFSKLASRLCAAAFTLLALSPLSSQAQDPSGAAPTGIVDLFPGLFATGTYQCSTGTQIAEFTGPGDDDGRFFAANGSGTAAGQVTFTGAGGYIGAGAGTASSPRNDPTELTSIALVDGTMTATQGAATYNAWTLTPTSLDFEYGSAQWNNAIVWEAYSLTPTTSATMSVTQTVASASLNFYFALADCDEDGVDHLSDPDDSNACIVDAATQALYATVVPAGTQVFLHAGLHASTGGLGTVAAGLATLDCDGDGTLASAESDDFNACVTPTAGGAIVTSAVAGGPYSIAANGADCDQDGENNSGAAGPDPDDFDPCHVTASAGLTQFHLGTNSTAANSVGGTATNCDNDADLNTLPDPDDFDQCVYTAVGTAFAGNWPDCDMDGNNNTTASPAGTDADDFDSCVTPVIPQLIGTDDCDMDLTPASADLDDFDPCVTPTHASPMSQDVPSGVNAPNTDCDGDGFFNDLFGGAGDDPDDGDKCNPRPCSDPLALLSSRDQSTAAGRAFGSIARHMQYRLGTSGQYQDDYLIQYDWEPEDRSLRNGGRWTAAGLTATELDFAGTGEGVFAYGIAGWDLAESDRSVWGYILGAEYGDWSYVDEGDAQKLGLSAGLYGARTLGENGNSQINGYLVYTGLWNELQKPDGDATSFFSNRLIGSVNVNRSFVRDNGWSFKPYLQATYAKEWLPEYEYPARGVMEPDTQEAGELMVGLELTAPFNVDRGNFFARIEAVQGFGGDAIELTNGTILDPVENTYGNIGIGWITNTGNDAIGRIELYFNDIGNDDRQEVRIDGHWERNL